MYSKSSSTVPLSTAYPQTNNLNSTKKAPSLASFHNVDTDLPDLSHLDPEEQKIIEAVLERQRAEEKSSPVVEKYNTLPLRLV